jgi:hypothetical protein
MKKIKRDKPIGILIHVYMEISQGIYLCSYLYLKQEKMSCISFSLFSFFFYKIREQDGRTCIARGEGLAPVGRRKGWGKVVGGRIW